MTKTSNDFDHYRRVFNSMAIELIELLKTSDSDMTSTISETFETLQMQLTTVILARKFDERLDDIS